MDDGANHDSKREQERNIRRFLRLAGFPLQKRTITPIVKCRGRIEGSEQPCGNPCSRTGSGRSVLKLGGSKLLVAVLSMSNRPSFSMRSKSGVVGGACKNPAMAQGMAARSMKSLCCSKISLGIRIETDDEACRHPKTFALDEANALQRITPQILIFLGFRQGLWRRTFDPDEDIKKVRLHHGLDQFGLCARSIEASV